MGRRTRTAALGLAVGALLVLGACASDRSESDSSATADGGGVADSVSAGDVVAAHDGRPLPQQEGEPLEGERRVVYTAALRLQVDDPAAGADAAIDVATEAGGSLASQDQDAGDEVRVSVRVPSDRFDEALDDLAALGTVLDRSVGTDDVTDQVVDLQGRLDNARASTERLRILFADAADVNQIVAIEAALTEREAEVEGLAGQLQVLEDEADLSTFTLTFTREGEPEVDDDIPGFGRGLDTGWVAFRNVASVAVTALGFLLPFLLVALPLAAVGRGLIRRRRRGTSRPTTTAPPTNATAGPPPPAPSPTRTGTPQPPPGGDPPTSA